MWPNKKGILRAENNIKEVNTNLTFFIVAISLREQRNVCAAAI